MTPEPMCSNECPDAIIRLCLKNGTVVPTPTTYGRLSVIVIVEIPDDTGVALSIT